MPTSRTPAPAAGTHADMKPAPQAMSAPPCDPAPATIRALIADLDGIISALENHIADMSYPGTDVFNVHTFGRHPFADDAYRALHLFAERVEHVSNDLYSAGEERRGYATLSPEQQTARTRELEEMAGDARASQAKDAGSQRGAPSRETDGTASPPAATVPGRYPDPVHTCGECGDPVETINGIHRC